MKNQYLKKLHKKKIVLVNETILRDASMFKLLASMYEDPSFLYIGSLLPTWCFEHTSVLPLPENLTITGALTLQWGNTTSLPKNLNVNTLDIRYTKITKLEFLTAKTIIISRRLIIDSVSVKFNILYTPSKQYILNYESLSKRIQSKISVARLET